VALDDAFDYFRAYDKSSFTVVACQGSEPSEGDVADFERRVGFRLPEEFREFTKSPLGGLYMEVREEVWPRAKEFEVGPFWSFLYGLKVFGIAVGIPSWLDIRAQFESFSADGGSGLVPFLQIVGDADRWCFDSAGGIVLWRHDDDERELESLTFSELLMREIGELARRKERKVRHEDRG